MPLQNQMCGILALIPVIANLLFFEPHEFPTHGNIQHDRDGHSQTAAWWRGHSCLPDHSKQAGRLHHLPKNQESEACP
jgi:hypothetical protein